MCRTPLVTAIIAAAMLARSVDCLPAQVFPNKPVTLVVPWPAGGATDVALRALAAATENISGNRSSWRIGRVGAELLP